MSNLGYKINHKEKEPLITTQVPQAMYSRISSMLRHDDPKPICIKAAKSHNFKGIYVNMMNLGNNIKLDILKSVFFFKRGIFVPRHSL